MLGGGGGGGADDASRGGRCWSMWPNRQPARLSTVDDDARGRQILEQTSPLTHVVLHTLRRAVVVASAVVLFGSRLAPAETAGAALILGGIVAYSRARAVADPATPSAACSTPSGRALMPPPPPPPPGDTLV